MAGHSQFKNIMHRKGAQDAKRAKAFAKLGRELVVAARRRGLISGSGAPDRAATLISRISLENTLARFASCAPLRYMMFLNCEWPAMGSSNPHQNGGNTLPAPARAPWRAIRAKPSEVGDSHTRYCRRTHGEKPRR